MKDIDSNYRILGLTSRASKDEIEAAHKGLLDKLYPDLLSPKSSVRKAAREKVNMVNDAYDELMLHMAESAPEVASHPSVASVPKGSEPPVREAIPEKKDKKAERLRQDISEHYIPPVVAVLSLLLYVSAYGISGIGSTLLAIIAGAAGWLAGHALIRGVNILNATKLQKNVVIWMTAALLFVILISMHVLPEKFKKVILSDSKKQATVKSPQTAAPAVGERKTGNEGGISKPAALSGGKVKPEEAASWLNKGKGLILAGKYPEAIDALTRSIELNPAAAAYNSRGVAYAYGHKYRNAAADYDKAIDLNPEGDGLYYLNRGIVRAAQGNYQDAVSDYRKAASLGNKEARDFFHSQNLIW